MLVKYRYWKRAYIRKASKISSAGTASGWNYFIRKMVENSPELKPIQDEYEEALLKAADASLKLDSCKKELKEKWLNDPEAVEKLRKEYKTERALKVLKRSIKK